MFGIKAMGMNSFHRLRTVPLPRGGRYGASRFLLKPRIQPRVQGLNPGRFNGGYGVPRGFKGEKSKFPPNPLGLAERVHSFHRLRGGSPPSRREVLGFRRSRPAALPSIAYRGFAVAPMTLRAPSRRFLYNSGCRTYEKNFSATSLSTFTANHSAIPAR